MKYFLKTFIPIFFYLHIINVLHIVMEIAHLDFTEDGTIHQCCDKVSVNGIMYCGFIDIQIQCVETCSCTGY